MIDKLIEEIRVKILRDYIVNEDDWNCDGICDIVEDKIKSYFKDKLIIPKGDKEKQKPDRGFSSQYYWHGGKK